MIPVNSTVLPNTLKDQLPYPETPWQISSALFTRISQQPLEPGESSYKKCEILPTDPESQFVVAYFEQQKPTHYTISKIFCLHTPALSQKFVAGLETIDQQAKTLKPEWDQEDLKPEREKVIARWKQQADIFYPISVPRATRKDTYFNVRMLPLWHGTSTAVCQAIASSGFTFFGKHHFFSSDAKAGSMKSTDAGYFGSGIYFTNSAKYASLYNSGQLLMAWVAMKEPFPVINDIPHPQKGKDMKMLYGKPAYQTYNAHYIPVAPLSDNPDCMEYFPCYQNQAPACDEIVVFQDSQTLPRFWVELTVDFFPHPLSLSPKPPSSPLTTTTTTTNTTTTTTTTATTPAATITTTPATSPVTTLAKTSSSPKPRAKTQQKLQELGLWNGCITGDLTFVITEVQSWWIKRAERINQANSQGYTPLMLAVQNGHFGVAEFLLKNQASPALSDPEGYQPLHWAAKIGHIKLVQLLVKAGARINSGGLYERTPLHMAAHNGHAPVVAWLLSLGAALNAKASSQDNCTTPLHEAVMREHLGVVQTLISVPELDVNLVDSNQHTPLYYAVVLGEFEMVQLITRHPSWLNPSHTSHPNHTSQLLAISPAKNSAAIQSHLEMLSKSKAKS